MRWIYRKIKNLVLRIFRIRKSILIPSLVIVIGLLTFGVIKFIDFYNYMEHEPEFCLSCHIMESSWDRWATSEHKDIECHSCHKQSLFASMSQLFNYAFRDYDEIETHAEVPQELCMNCHESGSSEWIQVANTPGHKLHSEEQGIQCTECHSSSVHRFEPLSLVCNQCHADQVVANDKMADMHCDTCHNFLVETGTNDQFLPSRESCLDCHEALAGKDMTWPADSPMQFDCGSCHRPHDPDQQIVECKSCHAEQKLLHNTVPHSAAKCITCHQPHAWETPDRNDCYTCHPGKVDHNPETNCYVCHKFN